MMGLALFVVVALVTAASWLAFDRLMQTYRSYESRMKDEARLRFDEFFLFLDPAHLWVALTLACALLGGMVFWLSQRWWLAALAAAVALLAPRSEEHTSELQSLMSISYAVVCLKNK